MHRRAAAILGIILLVLAAGAAGWGLKLLSERPSDATDTRPLVVATVPHVASWASSLVGEDARVETLVSGGVDVHEFSLTPATVSLVGRADVVLANGAGLEVWLDDLQAQAPGVTFVQTAEAGNVPVRESDPHTWLDPVLAQLQVAAAADAIAAAVPALATQVGTRAAAYSVELQNLDQQIATALADLPRSEIVTFHDAFGYFVDRYGLEVASAIVELPGDEPRLEDLQRVTDLAQAGSISTVFVEPGPVPDVAQSLGDELGLTLRVLDALESIDSSAGAYVAGMLRNLSELVAGLS